MKNYTPQKYIDAYLDAYTEMATNMSKLTVEAVSTNELIYFVEQIANGELPDAQAKAIELMKRMQPFRDLQAELERKLSPWPVD